MVSVVDNDKLPLIKITSICFVICIRVVTVSSPIFKFGRLSIRELINVFTVCIIL